MFRNYVRFCGGDLLASRPKPKLGDHTFSALRDCLLNVFAVTLHTGRRSSIRNLRTRHVLVTEAHLHFWCTENVKT
jgi:hypothetical protein